MALEVTDEARRQIGTVVERLTSDPVSARHVREYLVGTDDRHVSYDFALGEGLPVPPLFFSAAIREIVYERDLESDGQYRTFGVTGITGSTLEGGTDYTMHAPVHIGDVLTMERTLLSIDEKSGRSGDLAIVTSHSTFTNQTGVLVADFTHTQIFR